MDTDTHSYAHIESLKEMNTVRSERDTHTHGHMRYTTPWWHHLSHHAASVLAQRRTVARLTTPAEQTLTHMSIHSYMPGTLPTHIQTLACNCTGKGRNVEKIHTHAHTYPDPLISLKARLQAESLLCWTDLRTPCHQLRVPLYTLYSGLHAVAINVVNG